MKLRVDYAEVAPLRNFCTENSQIRAGHWKCPKYGSYWHATVKMSANGSQAGFFKIYKIVQLGYLPVYMVRRDVFWQRPPWYPGAVASKHSRGGGGFGVGPTTKKKIYVVQWVVLYVPVYIPQDLCKNRSISGYIYGWMRLDTKYYEIFYPYPLGD